MDASTTRDATAHLRLAEGLIKTANISDGASEYEIRNAFSRSYYALFHASHAYLRAAGVNIKTLGKKHGSLHAEMERQMGSSIGKILRSSYESRRKADYQPEWQAQPHYRYDGELKEARGQFYYVKETAERLISKGRLR